MSRKHRVDFSGCSRCERSVEVAEAVATAATGRPGRSRYVHLVEGRHLVVDREHAQTGHVTAAAPGRTSGSGPRPGARTGRGLDDQPVVVAEVDRSPARRRSETHGLARVPSPATARADRAPGPPRAVVLDHDQGVVAASSARIVTRPSPPCPRAVGAPRSPTSGWTGQHGTERPAPPARSQLDGEPVAEPGLLEDEVALDRAQLLGQRGELAVRRKE
jgi:hypothetical protein